MSSFLVYEQITATWAGGGFESLSASLLREGRAMLNAVTADIQRLNSSTLQVANSVDELLDLAKQFDFTIIIAPETEGVLFSLAESVRDRGGQLLGPTPEAIKLTTDKFQLARVWKQSNILTPETWEYRGEEVSFPVVVKPRDGAGSQATQLVCNGQTIETDWVGDLIAQEWIAGRAASVSLLCGPSNVVPLWPCWQELSEDGRFQYLGGRSVIDPEKIEALMQQALKAISVVPGLLGYVGVDLILADDGRVWAIEINPRFTTSYVGLRTMTSANLIDAMVRVFHGERLTLDWNQQGCEFDSEGQVRNS